MFSIGIRNRILAKGVKVNNQVDLDISDVQVRTNPYSTFSDLRQSGEIIWSERLGIWLAPTHASANAVLRAKTLGRIFTPRQPESEWNVFNWLHADSILDSEPPKHTRLRGLVQKAFTPGRIAALKPNIVEICEKLLDDAESKLRENAQFDLLADFAEPLPVLVIADLLGVPRQAVSDLRRWSQDIVKMYEVAPSDLETKAAQDSCLQFSEFIAHLARQRRENPRTDLITALVEVEEAGERLNEHELIAMCVLLLNAGHEASVNGFGNGFVALCQHPQQLAMLVQEPNLHARTALEEMMRFDSPLQLFERTAIQDTQIGSVTIKTGQKVGALLGAANRDPAVFEDADEFNILRDPNPHIAFGAGIHFCIGAPLARLEMQTSLTMLLERFPTLHLAGPAIQRPTFVLRGWSTIPVSI